MQIQVDFYRLSGKWYAGGLLEIGDVGLHQKEDFMQAVVDGQQILVDSWTAHGEYYVVTSPGKDDDRFVNALFLPHQFQGMKRKFK
jgi:hypothetical protein